MGALDYVSMGLILLMAYIVVYSLISRICKCIEYRASAKMYGLLFANGILPDEIKKNIAQQDFNVFSGEEKPKED